MSGGLLKGALYDQALAYAQRLWRYKWLSVGAAWLICMVGWSVVAMLPPKYESSARVYVNADQLLTPLLRGLAADVDPRRQVEFLQRTLLSRPNLEQVIHLSDLDFSSRLKISDKERENLLRQLAQQVTLKAQTANLVTISYASPNPVEAKNVVQALLTVFAENSTGGNRKEMENAKRFLDQQIEIYANQLRAAEQRRAEFREKYVDLLAGADGTASRLDVGRSNVAKLRLALEDVRAQRDALQRELESIPKMISVDAAGPQVVVTGRETGPKARLEQSQTKLQELLTRYTERHPDIIALRQQIAALEVQAGKKEEEQKGRKTEVANSVYDQLKVKVVEVEGKVASAERQLAQAEKAQEALEEKARATPGVQAQAQDLDRDYAVKKKNFDELLQRREQTRIGEAADTTADKIQFRIIDPPQVPIIAAAPQKPLLFSGVFGLALAGAIAVPVLLAQFDRSYSTVVGLRALGVPVLGSISWLAFPDGRRRDRIQMAAVGASTTVLLAVYVILLAISARMTGLGLI